MVAGKSVRFQCIELKDKERAQWMWMCFAEWGKVVIWNIKGGIAETKITNEMK